MLTRRVQRATAVCVLASFFAYACVSEEVLRSQDGNNRRPEFAANQGSEVESIEVLSNAGKSLAKVNKSQLAGVMREARTRSANYVVDTGAINSMRTQLERAASRTGKFQLSLRVLRAFSAPTRAERHTLLAALPVSKVAEAAPSHDDGAPRVATTYSVSGVPKLRVTRVYPGGVPGIAGTSSASPPTFDEVLCSDNCGDTTTSGGSGWATQMDRDDALTAAAVVQYDVEQANASFQSDSTAFAAFWASPAAVSLGGGESSSYPCLNADLAAAAGVLASVSASLMFVAVCLSPEPVSKLTLSFWATTAIGAGALAGVGVGNAINCHRAHSN